MAMVFKYRSVVWPHPQSCRISLQADLPCECVFIPSKSQDSQLRKFLPGLTSKCERKRTGYKMYLEIPMTIFSKELKYQKKISEQRQIWLLGVRVSFCCSIFLCFHVTVACSVVCFPFYGLCKHSLFFQNLGFGANKTIQQERARATKFVTRLDFSEATQQKERMDSCKLFSDLHRYTVSQVYHQETHTDRHIEDKCIPQGMSRSKEFEKHRDLGGPCLMNLTVNGHLINTAV